MINHEVLNALVGVFHVGSLPDVADNASVISFYHELQGSNSKGVPRLQAVLFIIKHSSIHPTRLPAVKIEIPED